MTLGVHFAGINEVHKHMMLATKAAIRVSRHEVDNNASPTSDAGRQRDALTLYDRVKRDTHLQAAMIDPEFPKYMNGFHDYLAKPAEIADTDGNGYASPFYTTNFESLYTHASPLGTVQATKVAVHALKSMIRQIGLYLSHPTEMETTPAVDFGKESKLLHLGFTHMSTFLRTLPFSIHE